jgi:hypothetical protein
MVNLRGLRGAVLVAALLIAFAHSLYVRAIFFLFTVGAYFLVATVLYVLGGLAASLARGRLFKIANLGLILLAIVDNLLIIYTRTLPSIFFGGRIVPWSMGWDPPGAVQVFLGQILLIILSGIILLRIKPASA